MDTKEYFESLSPEEQKELASLDGKQAMAFLAERGAALPDDALDDIAGGLNPFAIAFKAMFR